MPKLNYDENSRGDWERSFNSFSGCDILATFGGKIVGEIQGITFTIQREKVPLYVFGVTDPVAYSRGKRGIAGSAVFLTFDRNALQSAMADRSHFWARLREIRSRRLLLTGNDDALGDSLGNIRQTFTGKSVPTGAIVAQAWYADQIPPFNIVLTAANEYGGGAVMSIVGAEIVNDGSSISIDDPVVDQSMTYVARTILPWEPLIFRDPALEQALSVAGSEIQSNAIDQAVQEQQDLFTRGASNLVGIS